MNSLFGFDSSGTRPVVLCIVLNQTKARSPARIVDGVSDHHVNQCLYRPFDGGGTICERRESERRLRGVSRADHSTESCQVATVGLQTQRSVKCIGPLMEPTHRRTSMRTGLRLRCPPRDGTGIMRNRWRTGTILGGSYDSRTLRTHFLSSHLPVPSLHTGP